MKFLSPVVFLVIFSFFGELLAQELYRWVNDKGIIYFADSLHSIPEKYRRDAEKRLLAPAGETPTPTPQGDAAPSEESGLKQPGVPFFRQGNQITVEGFINQNVAVSFILDPGASLTILPPSIGSRLGINLGRSIPFSLQGVRGVVSGRLINVDSLRLGDVEMNDVEIAINEDGSSGMGLLGMDLLGRFRVHIDDHSNRMELVLKEEPYDGRSPEWWQEKFRFYRGLKQTYEKHLKRRKEEFHTIQQLSLLEEAVGDAARLQRILADIQVYEGYMRIVTQKIDDLDRRASDAALPRNFRE